METEKKDFATWCKQNNLLSKEKFEELKTDVSKHLQYQLKCTVEIKREPIYKDDPVNQTKLIQEYLQAVETVKKDKKLKTEEKLEKLLTPLVNLSKIVFPSNYASHLHFIDEDINLNNELDRDNLKKNPKKYFIVDDTELRAFGVLRASNKNIHLSEQYLAYLSFCRQVKVISEDEFYSKIYPNEKRNDHRSVNDKKNSMEVLIEPRTNCYSLNDIYKNWLLTLTPEKMKSNDLLDRILVTFTIKRALNRDEKAIDKLCSLFQDTAEAIAVEMAKKRYLKRYLPDIRHQAKILLRLQITGFSPLEILKGLTDDNDKGFLRIPKNVKKFYMHWLTKEVPEQLNKYPFLDFLDVPVLLNPISPVVSNISWQLTPKAIRKFNSFSFRPNNKTNLYTWLFGTKETPMKGITSGYMNGRFCQAMDEELSLYYKMKRKTNKKENDSTDESNGKENFDSNYGDDVSNEVRNGKDGKNKKNNEIAVEDEMSETQVINEYKNALMKHGISERDAEIAVRKTVEKISNTEIAKQYNLSRSSILKIRKKCAPILGKIGQQSI